jgi:hypothetical protein
MCTVAACVGGRIVSGRRKTTRWFIVEGDGRVGGHTRATGDDAAEHGGGFVWVVVGRCLCLLVDANSRAEASRSWKLPEQRHSASRVPNPAAT